MKTVFKACSAASRLSIVGAEEHEAEVGEDFEAGVGVDVASVADAVVATVDEIAVMPLAAVVAPNVEVYERMGDGPGVGGAGKPVVSSIFADNFTRHR